MAMTSLRLLRRCSLLGRGRAHHTLTTSPPRLMLPPAFDGQGNMVYQMYNLSQDRVESPNSRRIRSSSKEEELGIQVVGSSHGWSALFNPLTKNLFLSNPFTLQRINLPPLTTLLDDNNKDFADEDFTVSKLILSRPPSDGAEGEDKCVALMSFGFNRLPNRLACCEPGEKSKRPHCWTLVSELKHKEEDEKFDHEDYHFDGEFCPNQLGTCYNDLVYSQTHKLFFCITNYNHLQSWDLTFCSPDLESSVFIGIGLPGEAYNRFEHRYGYRDEPEFKLHKYLVFDDHSDQLFLLRRPIRSRVGHGDDEKPVYYGYRRGWSDSYAYKTMGFDVHKIDDRIVKWRSREAVSTYVEPGGGSLGGLAMFVGLNQSFALHADEFPELKSNSIYFTDNLNDASTTSARGDWHEEIPRPPKWIDRSYGGHDLGIFSYEDKTISPCYYPCDEQSIKRISPPPFWFTSS